MHRLQAEVGVHPGERPFVVIRDQPCEVGGERQQRGCVGRDVRPMGQPLRFQRAGRCTDCRVPGHAEPDAMRLDERTETPIRVRGPLQEPALP